MLEDGREPRNKMNLFDFNPEEQAILDRLTKEEKAAALWLKGRPDLVNCSEAELNKAYEKYIFVQDEIIFYREPDKAYAAFWYWTPPAKCGNIARYRRTAKNEGLFKNIDQKKVDTLQDAHQHHFG